MTQPVTVPPVSTPEPTQPSLREWYAGLALTALINNKVMYSRASENVTKQCSFEDYTAKRAVIFADSLIRQLKASS